MKIEAKSGNLVRAEAGAIVVGYFQDTKKPSGDLAA